MMFRVGQKVVCVDASPIPRGARFISADGRPSISNGEMGGLRDGAIYTVASVISYSIKTCLFLEQIPARDLNDPGFLASRFRPIVERKTDISFAYEILRKQTASARV